MIMDFSEKELEGLSDVKKEILNNLSDDKKLALINLSGNLSAFDSVSDDALIRELTELTTVDIKRYGTATNIVSGMQLRSEQLRYNATTEVSETNVDNLSASGGNEPTYGLASGQNLISGSTENQEGHYENPVNRGNQTGNVVYSSNNTTDFSKNPTDFSNNTNDTYTQVQRRSQRGNPNTQQERGNQNEPRYASLSDVRSTDSNAELTAGYAVPADAVPDDAYDELVRQNLDNTNADNTYEEIGSLSADASDGIYDEIDSQNPNSTSADASDRFNAIKIECTAVQQEYSKVQQELTGLIAELKSDPVKAKMENSIRSNAKAGLRASKSDTTNKLGALEKKYESIDSLNAKLGELRSKADTLTINSKQAIKNNNKIDKTTGKINNEAIQFDKKLEALQDSISKATGLITDAKGLVRQASPLPPNPENTALGNVQIGLNASTQGRPSAGTSNTTTKGRIDAHGYEVVGGPDGNQP